VILELIEDAQLAATLGDVLREKYSGGPPAGDGVWYFRVTSRTS
jgi:hypothetical protein